MAGRNDDDNNPATGNEGFIESVNDIRTGSSTIGNVTTSSTPTLFNIPYDYSGFLLPEEQVKANAQSVAGAD